MARGKAISVKIATPKIIKALETKLAQLTKDYQAQEANEAKYQKAYKAWQKEIGKWAITNFSKAENLRTNYRSWNKTLNVDFDIITEETSFPTEPEKDFEVIHQHTYREMKEEMENAIRILKMTDEETVSTSTYQAVARYL
jgi:DNA repair exonuclease SbcCD ATPase subunit